ncbi:MAG: hypothetical protein V4507_09070, partial [Verrucomicrobiota bacterium]
MKKDRWIKWILGGGIGFLVLGIALFAQRGTDIFSFEHFRAPQFSLRDPSMEDRPVVEVVSSPEMEKTTESTPSAEAEDSSAGIPSFRLQSDLGTRP